MTLAGLVSTITTTAGTLDLQASPYRLEKDTRSQQQVSKRKIDATNPFVEGTYTVAAVRDNVTEQINVYVQAASESATWDAIEALTEAFDQIVYTMTYGRGNFVETWTCFSAEYIIGTQHEFQHNGLAVVRATVPRLPTVTKVTV